MLDPSINTGQNPFVFQPQQPQPSGGLNLGTAINLGKEIGGALGIPKNRFNSPATNQKNREQVIDSLYYQAANGDAAALAQLRALSGHLALGAGAKWGDSKTGAATSEARTYAWNKYNLALNGQGKSASQGNPTSLGSGGLGFTDNGALLGDIQNTQVAGVPVVMLVILGLGLWFIKKGHR